RSKPPAHLLQQPAPELPQPPLEQHQLESMPRDMSLRDRIPAAMLDGHARFVAERLETHIDFGRLIVPETRQAPSERQPLPRQPVSHRADLPLGAIIEARDEPPARPRGIEA